MKLLWHSHGQNQTTDRHWPWAFSSWKLSLPGLYKLDLLILFLFVFCLFFLVVFLLLWWLATSKQLISNSENLENNSVVSIGIPPFLIQKGTCKHIFLRTGLRALPQVLPHEVSPVFLCRQGPAKPEVLMVQWPGKRSARRLQRNNSLSPNSPLFSTGTVFHILKIFKMHAHSSKEKNTCIFLSNA